MACMRVPPKKHKPAAAPATSRVGAALRREAAYRNELAAARRRRLEAVIAGAHPDDAPISTVPASLRLDTARWHEVVAPSPRRAEGEADEADEADAIGIAQRFLGSSFGAQFVAAAEGQTPSVPKDEAAIALDAPVSLEHVMCATARFGLHEASDAAGAGPYARDAASETPSSLVQAAAAAPATLADGSASIVANRPQPTAWEVDVTELRKPPPPPEPAREPPPMRTMLRPRPGALGRRSYTGWLGDFSERRVATDSAPPAPSQPQEPAAADGGAGWWDRPLADGS